jgi:hypothetical protein
MLLNEQFFAAVQIVLQVAFVIRLVIIYCLVVVFCLKSRRQFFAVGSKQKGIRKCSEMFVGVGLGALVLLCFLRSMTRSPMIMQATLTPSIDAQVCVVLQFAYHI